MSSSCISTFVEHGYKGPHHSGIFGVWIRSLNDYLTCRMVGCLVSCGKITELQFGLKNGMKCSSIIKRTIVINGLFNNRIDVMEWALERRMISNGLVVSIARADNYKYFSKEMKSLAVKYETRYDSQTFYLSRAAEVATGTPYFPEDKQVFMKYFHKIIDDKDMYEKIVKIANLFKDVTVTDYLKEINK